MTLLDDLIKTESLQGEDLDNALVAIRSKYTTEEDKKVMNEYMDARLDLIEQQLLAIDSDVDRMTAKDELGDLYDILPLAHIAKKYFNRSRGWLYQRLNGYTVNGKVCAFTEEERDTFNFALREVGERIGSMQLI